ncbi:MAG: alpha/beta hydrolase [Pseudomonadota bacterium]
MSTQNAFLATEPPPPDRATQFGLRPPAQILKFLEPRAVLETLCLLPSAPALALRARGDGRPIMVIPGFLTDDRSTWPLRTYLNWLGYRSQGWSMGRNNGQPERDAEVLAKRIDEMDDEEPITLIGWSLGGVVAREVARRIPHRVREIITMGTPIEGGPKYTIAGEKFAERQNLDLDDFEVHIHEINRKGVTVPITAIYSYGDGIVGWRAMIDRYNAHTRHRRVIGSHLGLGTNPLVWHIVERTLRRSTTVEEAAK